MVRKIVSCDNHDEIRIEVVGESRAVRLPASQVLEAYDAVKYKGGIVAACKSHAEIAGAFRFKPWDWKGNEDGSDGLYYKHPFGIASAWVNANGSAMWSCQMPGWDGLEVADSLEDAKAKAFEFFCGRLAPALELIKEA